MSAGIATLELIREQNVWVKIEELAKQLEQGIGVAAAKAGVPITQTRVGTMFTTFFGDIQARHWSTVKEANAEQFAKFFRMMLEQGVYLAPSQFEAGFLSITHTAETIDRTLEAVQIALASL